MAELETDEYLFCLFSALHDMKCVSIQIQIVRMPFQSESFFFLLYFSFVNFLTVC